MKSKSGLLMACILIFILFVTVSITTKRARANEFELPCIIETYGNAWEGYLAYGLFEYNSSDVWDFIHAYLIIMSTDGHIIYIRDYPEQSYNDVEYIPPDLLMYQGEPRTNTHFLNLTSKEIIDLHDEIGGHHDIEFNPITNTFLTLHKDNREINGTNISFDKIVEINMEGEILWTWYVADYFNLTQQCPWSLFRRGAFDFSHCNTVSWNIEENIIYLNIRNLNTFCKINKTSGELVWSCGEYGDSSSPETYHGDFTLLDSNGNNVSSLWYHSHSVKEVEPNVFIMFDNDLHNKSDLFNRRSRIIEVTINETTKTAWISWNWTAPREYYSSQWGDADRLPNGNRIGTFGAQQHDVEHSTGAVLVEVNSTGSVVREYIFPYGWGIYRIEQTDIGNLLASVGGTGTIIQPDIVGGLTPVFAILIAIVFIATSRAREQMNERHRSRAS